MSSATGQAQTDLDSLYTIWEDSTVVDTSRAIALEDYIRAGPLLSDGDRAIALSDTLAIFARSIGLLKEVVTAYELSGYASFRTGDYVRSLEMYGRGVALADSIQDLSGKANILTKTGFVYHDNDDVTSGLGYYKQALAIFISLKDSSGIASIYNEFGNIYSGRGELEKALEYFLKSIQIHALLGEEEASSAAYSNISAVYDNMGDTEKAVEYVAKSMAIAEARGDKIGMSACYAGLGFIHEGKAEWDEAIHQFNSALAIDRSIGNVLGIASNLTSLSFMFYEKKEYSKSVKFAKEVLLLSKDLGDIGLQEEVCQVLYLNYKEIGNSSKALEFYELRETLRDSIDSEETAMQLQQFEFRKEVVADSLLQVEKERQVATAHLLEVAGKNRNRNYAIGASIFFLALAGGFYSRWRYVRKSRAVISKEKERSDNLLLNILPAEIAEELMATGKATARDYDLVSVLFTDFKGFSEKSAEIKAVELIDEINVCFQAFDNICEQYQVEKIKTIGDAYMAAGGLPVASDTAAYRTVLAALEMQEFMQMRFAERLETGEFCFEMRLGINTGPVVAGIVGIKKFQYDIWGDTVNTASRLESAGSIGKVNVSESTYELLKDKPDLQFVERGAIEVKGKGAIKMWFVELIPDPLE
ncbi:MAG: adenylate/guanylate cyclase domain-containing protein [Saprospiraceae bacterium]